MVVNFDGDVLYNVIVVAPDCQACFDFTLRLEDSSLNV